MYVPFESATGLSRTVEINGITKEDLKCCSGLLKGKSYLIRVPRGVIININGRIRIVYNGPDYQGVPQSLFRLFRKSKGEVYYTGPKASMKLTKHIDVNDWTSKRLLFEV